MDRLLRAGAVSAAAALFASAPAATASAQTRSGQTAVGSTSLAASYEAPQQRREDGFDPGWFGLLGLAGLFGLRRPRDETTTTRTRLDATPVTRRP